MLIHLKSNSTHIISPTLLTALRWPTIACHSPDAICLWLGGLLLGKLLLGGLILGELLLGGLLLSELLLHELLLGGLRLDKRLLGELLSFRCLKLGVSIEKSIRAMATLCSGGSVRTYSKRRSLHPCIRSTSSVAILAKAYHVGCVLLCIVHILRIRHPSIRQR